MIFIVREIAEKLTQIEVSVLRKLAELERATTKELSEALNTEEVVVARACMFLENKGLVRGEYVEKERYVLTEKAKVYEKTPLPEDRLFNILKKRKEVRIDDLNEFSKEELSAAIGTLKRMGVAVISGNKIILLSDNYSERTPRLLSLQLSDKEIKEFMRRGLIKKEKVLEKIVEITDLGRSILDVLKEIKLADRLTHEMLVSGEWKRVKFRRYDVESPLPKIYGGRRHPLKELIEEIRRIFLEMGFEEMEGPWVETAFWNFDAMFQPQDHPARDLHDTIYLQSPSKGDIPKGLAEKVREVHESKWKYRWSEDIPKQLILRTHTTAVSFRYFGKGINVPGKYFCIGRVFRNETIDWKHLAEFHQVEGFVVDKDLSLRDLMGVLKEFYSRFGINKIRFKPVYNPYTEPSMEVFGYVKGKWIEIGNSGIFRPEALKPYGLDKYTIIAWGLALERLAMILYDIDDIREVFGTSVSLSFIRRHKTVGLWRLQR